MERYWFPAEELKNLELLPTPLAVYQFVDRHIYTLALSDGYREMFELTDKDEAYRLLNEDVLYNTYPDDISRIEEAVRHFISESGRYEAIFRAKKYREQDCHIIHAVGKHIHTKTGVRLAYVWFTDEGAYTEDDDTEGTALNRAFNNALHEESILRAGFFDSLTGLPNMTRFFTLAEDGKKAVQQGGGEAALLYLDLNGMKNYNDNYSFAEGDKLLKEFAGLLERTFGKGSCCHISGDRFAVYAGEAGLEDALGRLFADAKALNGGNSLPVRAGIYTTAVEDVPVSTAFDRAKIACDAIPASDVSIFNYYSEAMRRDIKRRQYILSRIDRAIAEKWIVVYYQPLIRAVNGKVCDEEALARWIDPVEGFMSPADFIPVLEENGLIYKLDLYVLEQVLEKMKEQVTRFQQLGFPVWMDDFGSGYSSLDVLQTIKFDLLKFDMSFMQKLDEGEGGKIILTDLMKMATALGVDTVCEGVETQAQVQFLQEIGCSKLQGFYFSRPVPLETLMERHRAGTQTEYENPDESAYYEDIGRINLYDMSVIANKGMSVLQNAFDTIPMGIIEVKGDMSRFVRSNRSYRNFVKGFFGVDLACEGSEFHENDTPFMRNLVKSCCERGSLSLYDEKMPDGSVVHSFARRISENPVTGCVAVAVTVLSVTDSSDGATYADIARALAGDYYNIYVVDLDTDQFIEYTSPVGEEELAMERHGEDFFTVAKRDTMTRIYEEDREPFLAVFSKEKIIEALDAKGVFTATYRLIDTGVPVYASLKITRMHPRENRIIMGVSIIESQIRRKEAEELARRQNTIFRRMAALSGKYTALYTIDPETGFYYEYNGTSDYGALGYDKAGDDFFVKGRLDGRTYIYPEDLPFFLESFTRENVMRAIGEKGLYEIRYRIMVNDDPKPITLRVARVRESDGDKLVAGVSIMDNA